MDLKRIKAKGPLTICKKNPRYFADADGKAVYLTGAHTWENISDRGPTDPPAPFDFNAYLDFLEGYGHNFTRLWTQEVAIHGSESDGVTYHIAPMPYRRTGPGKALDGHPKFNLTQLDPEYFERLRSRAIAAGGRGIYVSVMLFEGWGIQFHKAPWNWAGHPMNRKNNINGIDGDPNKKKNGLACHTLDIPAITKIQEAYVRKVVDTVNDLDNVIYEICNETGFHYSTQWQYHFVRFIKEYQAKKPKQHPVGMTGYGCGNNAVLFQSAADWISPGVYTGWNETDPYKADPPVVTGAKVVFNDTDHIWGIGGGRDWVWKSFLRGYYPIFMDNYRKFRFPRHGKLVWRYMVEIGKKDPRNGPVIDPQWDPARIAIGQTLAYARRIDLANMIPHGELALGGYCLANPGREYLAYLPQGGKTAVDLTKVKGSLAVEWFDPASERTQKGKAVAGGDVRTLTSPFKGDTVLYLHEK